MDEKDSELRFELLGPPRILRGDAPLALSSGKGQALLFYLAVTNQRQPRSALAHLLWSEMSDRKALTNLRVTLSKLRPAVGDWLQITRKTVAWQPGADVWSDVSAFEAACDRETPEGWQAAAAHYRGDLLQSFAVPAAPAFDEWVLLEQERLHRRMHHALRQLVMLALAEPTLTETGIIHARRLLALDPWREEAHRQLMQLLARSGRRGEALAQFERCRQILAEEFGSEPGPETRALYQRLRDRARPASSTQTVLSPAEIPHNLPAPTTSFVGREASLAQIASLWAESGCRLLTLAGLGGIGKTRLALAAARQALVEERERFADGIFLVPLAAAESKADLINAIAHTLDLTLDGTAEPAKQVADYLGSKRLLLILDNFEQMTESAPLLADWLAAAAGIKIMVTSRQRLHLYEEWVLDVPGLSAPGAGWHPEKEAGAEPLRAFPAARLFVDRARRVNLRFEPVAEADAVAEICRLTGGIPLALEMAAAWVRSFSCREIAAELRQNLDLLSSTARNRPDRHQSMRATFAYSWQLLSEAERSTLSRLTVFRGGFSLAAAQAVAGTTSRLLARLVDKSLVQRQSNGRYQMHGLLRHFAAEHLLAPGAAAHAAYFGTLLVEHTSALRGPQSENAVAALVADIDNIRAMWRRFVAEGDEPALSRALLALFELYDARSWYVEGEWLLAEAAAVVDEETVLAARLAALRARFLTRQGQLEQAERFVRESLPRLPDHDAREYGDALNNLNNILRRAGRYEEARAVLDQAQTVYEAAGFSRGVASVLNNRGLAAYRQGDYEQAAALQQQSADLYRQTGPRKDLATVLNNLGLSRLYLGEPAAAASALEESVAIAREIGYHGCLVVATQNLGLAAMRRGAWELAEQHLLRSLHLAEEVGVQDMAGHAHNDLSVFYLRRQKHAAARKHGEAALAVGEALGMQWLIASAQGNLAEVALAEGSVDETESRLRAGLALADELAAEGLQSEMLLVWAMLLEAKRQPEAALKIAVGALAALAKDPEQRQKAQTLVDRLHDHLDDGRGQNIDAEAPDRSLQAWVASILGRETVEP